MRKPLEVATLGSLITFLSLTMACGPSGSSSTSGVPEPPRQDVIQEYGADQERADSALNELASIKNSIQQGLEQWRNTPGIGPDFPTEAGSLADEIRSKCDDLESQATKLLEEPFVRNHQGAPETLSEYLKFVRETRDEVGGETKGS